MEEGVLAFQVRRTIVDDQVCFVPKQEETARVVASLHLREDVNQFLIIYGRLAKSKTFKKILKKQSV